MLIARLRTLLVLLVLLGVSSLVLAAEDATLSKAADLIKANDFKSAYALLEPLEAERAGDINYDYLFGVAAVESDNVTRGVFALERVLATNPNHLDARAEIAKAYFRLGESETSKTEFQTILSQKPPKEVETAIEKYMSAIDKALGLTTTFAAYLDIGVGFDSNINSATSATTINLSPTFIIPQIVLPSGAQEQSSKYGSLAAGASFRQPLTTNLSMFGSVQGQNRTNWNESQFDPSFIDYNVGLTYKKHIDTFTGALQGNTYDIDGERFRRSYGALGQWQRDLDDRNQVSLYGQYAKLSYPSSNVRDADRYIVGGGWAHVFAGDKSPVLFLGPYVGKENTEDSAFDFLSNSIYGVRAGGQLTMNPKLVAYAGTSYEYRDYDGRDPIFGETRRDNQFDFNIGLRYLPGHKWTIRPQFSYLKNDSNTTIFDFDRTVLSVNFRKDFNW
jgi:tetratricopeptide (TPR) repeat protein